MDFSKNHQELNLNKFHCDKALLNNEPLIVQEEKWRIAGGLLDQIVPVSKKLLLLCSPKDNVRRIMNELNEVQICQKYQTLQGSEAIHQVLITYMSTEDAIKVIVKKGFFEFEGMLNTLIFSP